jgi:hypothetical protein
VPLPPSAGSSAEDDLTPLGAAVPHGDDSVDLLHKNLLGADPTSR